MTAAPVPSFALRLVRWQREHGRHDLPWQSTRDPYRVWLSEIMLQQTQVATVIPYFLRFVAAFPDLAALGTAPLDRVLEHWSGLGYYRRAHHLHAAARACLARHGGELPRDVAALAALPGVGRSTAAAIAVLAFGTREAILDGNVKRVLARHAGVVDGYPGERRSRARCGSSPSRCCPQPTGRHLHAGADGPRGHRLHAHAAELRHLRLVRADCVALRDGQVSDTAGTATGEGAAAARDRRAAGRARRPAAGGEATAGRHLGPGCGACRR